MSNRHLMLPYLVLDDALLSGMSLFAPEEVFPAERWNRFACGRPHAVAGNPPTA